MPGSASPVLRSLGKEAGAALQREGGRMDTSPSPQWDGGGLS